MGAIDSHPEIGPDPEPEIGLDPERVARLHAEGAAVLVDVREPYEREAGRIAGSRHVEMRRLPQEAASLDGELPIVFYCRVGSRSDMAAQAFRASGRRAYSLRGGLVRWVGEGRPLEPEDGYVADH
jgi:rhodanese-related sulfurtransferase